MSTKFLMTRDVAGYNGFGLAFTDQGVDILLTANTATSTVVPSQYPYYIAIFSYSPGSSIGVDNINTATLPSSSFASSTTRLNPAARLVKKGSTLSFITADTNSPWVDVAYYIAPPYVN